MESNTTRKWRQEAWQNQMFMQKRDNNDSSLLANERLLNLQVVLSGVWMTKVSAFAKLQLFCWIHDGGLRTVDSFYAELLRQKWGDCICRFNCVALITTLKNNMKPKVIAAFDKLILRKPSIIETINDQLKNVFSLEHSCHRSLINFLVNAIASLVTYSYQEKNRL